MILGDISSQRLTLRRLPGSFAELTNKANQRQRGLNVKHRLMAMLFGNYSTSLQWDNSSTPKCAEVTCTSATEAMTWEFRCWYTDSPTLWDIQLIQPNYILARILQVSQFWFDAELRHSCDIALISHPRIHWRDHRITPVFSVFRV